MPRQPRLDAPGVLHHVMARGIERRAIFVDDKDRKAFLDRLAEILEKTQTQCYAWTLIPNHCHLFLRIGLTPLSTVMRRLMTGHAVVFNRRHHRTGHLFQNRYKSVICEENQYFLELIRYIHLNPLRAGLVEDLNALDKYPWSGHSVLVGKRKNPLIPEAKAISRPDAPGQPENPFVTLAERTVGEVLRNFCNDLNDARLHYRAFVEKGMNQGRRPEFQGGGLVRSAGGDKATLKRVGWENRELSDRRILGSGDFVGTVLHQAERLLEKKYQPKRSIEDLIALVAARLGISAELICSGNRQRKISAAKSLVAYLAVEKSGHTIAEVGRYLGMQQASAFQAVKKGKILSGEIGISLDTGE